jgi:PAS domain S-box-containing protein
MALRKANVLVVDDRRANLIALEAVLGDAHNLLYAESGEQAIATLQRRRDVDLILMDVQMPGLDGFETAQLIKRTDGCGDIPIIFVTAIFTEDPWIRKGYEVGGIDYFSKPFDPEILKLKVAVYASFRQKESFLRERELHIRESEELLRAGRKLSALLESLPVGVLIADLEGRICQSTEEVGRILNTAGAAEADAYGELLGWWDSAGRALRDDAGPLARALQHGESSQGEPVRVRRFNGALKTIAASASPLRGLDGNIVGAVILIQDLTETKKIEADLQSRVTGLITLGVALEQTGRDERQGAVG